MPPSNATVGAHQIIATLLDSGNIPVAGTEASAPFTVQAGPTPTPTPTATPSSTTSSGPTPTTSEGATVPSQTPSASAGLGPGEDTISHLDLGGQVPVGTLDPLSSFVAGGSGTLWPYLAVINALAITGIVLLVRRWRRTPEG
jgi:hypothetical protein